VVMSTLYIADNTDRSDDLAQSKKRKLERNDDDNCQESFEVFCLGTRATNEIDVTCLDSLNVVTPPDEPSATNSCQPMVRVPSEV